MKPATFILVVLLILCGFGSGMVASYEMAPEPYPYPPLVMPIPPMIPEMEIVYVERIVYEPYFVIQEVPVYITRTEEVEVPREFKEFPSVEFLESWYERNEPPVDISQHASKWDCDDYAFFLQEKALSQGWLMSVELVDGNHHMLNSVTIGNDILLIEPNPMRFNAFKHRIWKVGERD